MALPMIGAGVSIGSSILGMAGGLSGQKKGKQAAEEQAKLTFMTRQEEIRRARGEQEAIMGYNRAAVGASNIQFSGSSQRALNKLQEQFARDVSWQYTAALKERTAIKRGAPGSAERFATIAGGVGSIANTIMSYHGSK